MPPGTPTPVRNSVDFSVEDAMLNTWVEDTGVYLSLETPEPDPPSPDKPADQG